MPSVGQKKKAGLPEGSGSLNLPLNKTGSLTNLCLLYSVRNLLGLIRLKLPIEYIAFLGPEQSIYIFFKFRSATLYSDNLPREISNNRNIALIFDPFLFSGLLLMQAHGKGTGTSLKHLVFH